jgi:mannose-6-phosphate isomerase-like protein (cupin superfamily)
MKIKNRKNIVSIQDNCGRIQEMHNSKNLSISYATIKGKAKSHKHNIMEEVYYIVKGEAKMFIGKESFNVKTGDVIPIPKKIYHHIENNSKTPIEIVVVTHPKYIKSDNIEE